MVIHVFSAKQTLVDHVHRTRHDRGELRKILGKLDAALSRWHASAWQII